MQLFDVFAALNTWFRANGIKPSDVEIHIYFKGQKMRDAAAFALAKERVAELEYVQGGSPVIFHSGTLAGIRYGMDAKGE